MRTMMVRLAVFPSICLLLLLTAAIPATSEASGASTSSPGYWLMTGFGSTYAFNAPYLGSELQTVTQSPCQTNGGLAPDIPSCVAISATSDGQGYWIGDSGAPEPTHPLTYSPGAIPEGNIGSCDFATGPPVDVNAPLVGIAAAPMGAWLVTSDGGVFAVCGAPFYGSAGAIRLNEPIVGVAPTPDGGGYWVVASDGGVFAYGDASFYGSTGAIKLNEPIVGMASTPDGKGYWLVASDGGVFAFGDAAFEGSMAGKGLTAPMVGIAANPDGTGYWTVASDGGVFSFGDAPFLGSAAAQHLDAPIVGIASKS